MLSSHIDSQFALFLAQQRQKTLLAEVEHDRLVDKIANSAGGSHPERKGASRFGLQFIGAMFAALSRV